MSVREDSGESGTALVTGAGGGIGCAIARSLQQSGWQVIGVDRHFPDPTAGYLCQAQVSDLADQAQFRECLESLQRDYSVDCLVNCAGISRVSRFLEQDEADWQQMIAVNYLAPLTACHTLLPAMVKRGQGSVIQITSDSSRTGAAGEAVYSGTKGALVAFSKSLAQEMGRFNIRVNCVSPGVVLTPMSAPNQDLLEKFARRVPMKRLGEPEDIAAAVRFLASDEAAYITGQIISVGGGLTMAD